MKSRKIASTSMSYVEQHHHYHQIHHQPQLVSDPNAWKAEKMLSNDPTERETQELLNKVRAILNKLTPQNYENLLKQFKNLKIDTEERLSLVIDIIFDKAVKEPAFVVQYAGFCSELVHIKVEKTDKNDKKGEVKFKNLLIKKCEETFYKKMYSDIPDLEERLQEIEDCTDSAKKKELHDILDDDKRFSRKRSVGNIKLIAELYKINMLNIKIMFSCFLTLIELGHEDYIECLCTLITNIGKTVSESLVSVTKDDKRRVMWDEIFNRIKNIHDGKSDIKVSSRIKFMILDLLDLRDSNWVPRRKTEGPKTIAQVHQDLENQQRQKAMEINELKNRRKNQGKLFVVFCW